MSSYDPRGEGDQGIRRGQDDDGDDDLREDRDYDVHHVAVESASSVAARRQRRKALITLGVVVLSLFFAFWWAYSYYKASGGNTAAPKPSASATCQPASAALTPTQVTINVFNSTTKQGLAASAAKEFTAQGYVVGQVSNDPLKKSVAGPAEVRFGPSGKAASEVVLASVGEGAVAVEDARPDASVDVALGVGWVAIKPLPSPSSTLPVCPPSPAPSATP